MNKYPDDYYVKYDPFQGDDTEVKMNKVKVVKSVRCDWNCWLGMCPPEKPHIIKKGSPARYESALVEGKWCAYYICLPCLDRRLESVGIKPPKI